MFARGLQSRGMTSPTSRPLVELRPETAADADVVDGWVRGHLIAAMGAFDPGPLIDIQVRSREAMLAQRFPDLERRVAWVGEARAASLLTGPLDDALHVVEIITAPEWRRRGVGATVLAAVAGEARTMGRDVTAQIFASNTASLALFAAAGFAVDLPPAAAQATARLRTNINVR